MAPVYLAFFSSSTQIEGSASDLQEYALLSALVSQQLLLWV
jgi:hypothetical protein